MKFLFLIIFLSACGLLPKSNKPKPANPVQALKEKYDVYLPLANARLDSFGFVSPKCDSLLYSSLARVAGLTQVEPLKAEKSPGQYHRHPSFSCYPAESKSSVSKDMFVGLYHYLLATKNKDALVRIKDYGAANKWVMGEAVDTETLVSRAVLSPKLIAQLYRMLGLTSLTEDSEDAIFVKLGYEGHLHVLGIYLDGIINAGMSDFDLKILRGYTDALPKNSLYCAIYHKFFDGVYDSCLGTLLSPDVFPAVSLPTSENYCTEYLWSRMDDSEDVAPCPQKGETHPGVDFIYAASIILGVK